MKQYSRTTAAIALALAFASQSALAHPVCQISKNGNNVRVTIIDTGLVYTDGKQPPAGVQSYPGTGRQGDITVSCKDAPGFCGKTQFFARPADSRQGWAADGALDDPRVIRGTYDPKRHAMTFAFEITNQMRAKDNKLHLHFGARDPAGNIVAAYQPQARCTVEKDGQGNPHTVL